MGCLVVMFVFLLRNLGKFFTCGAAGAALFAVISTSGGDHEAEFVFACLAGVGAFLAWLCNRIDHSLLGD